MIKTKELVICRRRGHDFGNLGLGKHWSQCKWCGMWARQIRTTEEREDEPPAADQDPIPKLAKLESKAAAKSSLDDSLDRLEKECRDSDEPKRRARKGAAKKKK